MSAPEDNSYLITGKVCPPKLPMQKIAPEGWSSLTPSLLDSLFNEVPVQERHTNNSSSLCALSFQASVWLSTDGLSAASVGGLPYFLCNFCDYHTDSKAKLLQHVVCRHVFRCKLCDFVSFTLHELVQHQLHKHLDAEEMQPVLNSKMVLMNFSLFQRNLKMFSQRDNISSGSMSSDGRPVESEIANSSVQNISKACPTGHHSNQSQPENDQLEDLHVKYDNPVTSSKDKMQYNDAEVQGDNGGLNKASWNVLIDSSKAGNVSKRNYLHEGLTDCELSPKRFKKSCNEISEAPDNLFDQSRSHSCQMPHFLDDSDSFVTSSCSPHKNTAPVISEIRQDQNSFGRKLSEAEETYTADQMLSFFMETTSSAASRDLEKSEAKDYGNSAAEFGPLRKSSPLFDDFYHDDVSKEAEVMHSSRIHNKLPGSLRMDQSILPAVSEEADSPEEKSSQPPELSGLSKKDLRKLSEKETSERSLDPHLESCTDILELLRHRNNWLQQRSSASHETEVPVSNSDSVPGKRSRGRQPYCQDVTSEDVENFLLLPGKSAQIEFPKENSSSVDRGSDRGDFYVKYKVSESSEADLSVHEKESYDLLRRLLLGTVKSTNLSESAPSKSKEKPAEFLANKDLSNFHFPQTNEDDSRFQNRALVVTRASDMTLRDLLTQGLGTVHRRLFFECSYCNFKSNSKTESQKHIKVCEFKFAQNKRKTVEILTEPNYEVDMVKTETSSSKCGSLNNDYSSETFIASELLKGLSEHYSDSLGSDGLLHDKSEAVKNQLYTSQTLHSENQVSARDKASVSKNSSHIYSSDKSPMLTSCGQIYSCDKSHALKNNIQINACDNPQILKNDSQNTTSQPKDNLENIRRKHISIEIESNDNKHDVNTLVRNEKNVLHYYSDSLDELNNFSSCDKQNVSNVKQDEEKGLTIPLKRKHDFNIEKEFCSHASDLSSERQQKPQYACMYCDFASDNIIFVRQHIFRSHPTNASFVEVFIPSKGKNVLYLCKGVDSTCTFLSSESEEIFEHIKICYSGCLDNFIDSDDKISHDYSDVLFSLGQASGFINTSTAMFHCLRCSYYVPDYQQIADHISENHASLVVGVLSVNRSFIEPRIRMVCLVCKAHINVKNWVTHHCRKSLESKFNRLPVSNLDLGDLYATKLETILRPSSLTGYQSCDRSSSSTDSPSLALESADQVDCKSHVKTHLQSFSPAERINNPINASNRYGTLSKSFTKNNFSGDVGIKLEVPDLALQELQQNDVDETMDFEQHEQSDETVNQGTGLMPFIDMETNRNNIENNQAVQTTNSPQSCSRKRTSGSSVLHSLLTASGNLGLNQQSFSSLHKLPELDIAAEDNRPPNAIPSLQADFISAAADLHSQYPCILEILKRPESASQETIPGSPPLSIQGEVHLKEENTDFITTRTSSLLLNALCHPDILSQQIHATESTCLPKLHLLLPNEASEKGPLPHKSTTAFTTESQDTTGPFTNLLQLLCQSKKSSS